MLDELKVEVFQQRTSCFPTGVDMRESYAALRESLFTYFERQGQILI